jgi:HEAT repeat protein
MEPSDGERQVSAMIHEVRTEVGEVQVGTEACFQHLLESLRDPDPKVRSLAVCGLAAAGDIRAVGALIGTLDDVDPEIRRRAAVALGKLGDRTAASALRQAARGTDVDLHRAAIMALGELDAGLDVLAESIKDGDPAERARAAIALGETHDVNAIPPLTDALTDDDPTVRSRAREALEKIGESPVF